MGCAPEEVTDHAVVRRRGEDQLADRRGMVEGISELRAQARDVEGVCAQQADLLRGREEQLEPDGRLIHRVAARNLEQHRDRGLVVRAEDCLAAISKYALRELDLDAIRKRNRVEMSAEHHGAGAFGPGDSRDQVPAIRPGLGRARVLLHREPERFELRAHEARRRGFVPARALDLAERDERLREPGPLGRAGKPVDGHYLVGAVSEPWNLPERGCSIARSPATGSRSAVPRSRARSSAAPTKVRKSGSGRLGRDLNSGGYWEATKNAWSGSSITSTRRSSGAGPLENSPASSRPPRRKVFTSDPVRWGSVDNSSS